MLVWLRDEDTISWGEEETRRRGYEERGGEEKRKLGNEEKGEMMR